jgi:hypothetical protein
MGQLVAVTEKPSRTPGVFRFEINRSLSGMGHERFPSADAVRGDTPSAQLARQLFATGNVEAVHVYGNIITVDVAKGHGPEGISEIIRHMYQYWKPGVQPPSFEDLQPDEPAADAGGGDSGGEGLSEAAKLIPPHLLERSRAARERWNAKKG